MNVRADDGKINIEVHTSSKERYFSFLLLVAATLSFAKAIATVRRREAQYRMTSWMFVPLVWSWAELSKPVRSVILGEDISKGDC
jgi:hypothetical protein